MKNTAQHQAAARLIRQEQIRQAQVAIAAATVAASK